MHPVLIHIGALQIPSYGAMAAVGVLVALLLAQRTAAIVGVAPQMVWNVCVIALIAALAGSRMLLLAFNWGDVLRHPLWMLGLATIHNPPVAIAGALVGGFGALASIHRQRMPLLPTLDALAAPFVFGLAFEQFGSLLAGAGFGSAAAVPWAVVYTDPLAQRWSGTPLGVPLHPVQAYTALVYIALALGLFVLLPARRQAGDGAGLALMGMGVAVFVTEFWRDPEGRGQLLEGALDGPQVAAILLVLAGGFLLRERKVAPTAAADAGAAHE